MSTVRFKTRKAEPQIGEGVCRRCSAAVYRLPSKKNPEKIVTVDERIGPYVLEEQDDGSVVAVWAGPEAGYAYHYNREMTCASDEDIADANDV